MEEPLERNKTGQTKFFFSFFFSYSTRNLDYLQKRPEAALTQLRPVLNSGKRSNCPKGTSTLMMGFPKMRRPTIWSIFSLQRTVSRWQSFVISGRRAKSPMLMYPPWSIAFVFTDTETLLMFWNCQIWISTGLKVFIMNLILLIHCNPPNCLVTRFVLNPLLYQQIY